MTVISKKCCTKSQERTKISTSTILSCYLLNTININRIYLDLKQGYVDFVSKSFLSIKTFSEPFVKAFR